MTKMFSSNFLVRAARSVAKECTRCSSVIRGTVPSVNSRHPKCSLLTTSMSIRSNPSRFMATDSKSKERTDEERRKQLESNPYYAKYAAKLEDADLSKLDTVKEEPRSDIFHKAFDENSKKEPSGRLTAESNPEMKPLDSIMKLELLENLTGEEIGLLWQNHHADESYIGVEFFYQQFRGNQIAFTSLLEYKTHNENARPYLLLNHYVELLESKGVVLMAGDLDDNINVMDAQFLANQVQLYYLGDDDAYDVVKQFNHRPDEFDYNVLLNRLDTLIQGNYIPMYSRGNGFDVLTGEAAELEKKQS